MKRYVDKAVVDEEVNKAVVDEEVDEAEKK